MTEGYAGPLEKIDDYRWKIPRSYKSWMRVDGIIYADERMIQAIRGDKAPEQVANAASLPGIVKVSLAMPDIHWGYGLPIGGVVATDPEDEGTISPGGVGYDINCGVRLVRTDLTRDDLKDRLKELVVALFRDIPAGVGTGGDIKVSKQEEAKILEHGAAWGVDRGYGEHVDLEFTEASGCLDGCDSSSVSKRAYERGGDQSGTLGSGNHFLEIQVVDEIYDSAAAEVFGIFEGQVTIMIHSGSRGLGHQICEDHLRSMGEAMHKYGISVPDRQLACAPVNSPEGRAYMHAMQCAANYAWNNRQCLMHLTRVTFERFFKKSWGSLGMRLVYDVAHNIAKFEKHSINGKEKVLCVHRKGATRAFPPGHPELPQRYRVTGQPVIIPGDMGRNSYLLVGTERAMKETFGSTCHGAGRLMSRGAAVRAAKGRSIRKELEAKGIIAIAHGREGLDEEQPAAYKDVNEVVNVVHEAGISKKVCRMRPLGVVKG
jgi:tRNA-splicing ligase RtcB